MLLLCLPALPFASSFISGECYSTIVARLKHGTLSPNDDTVFYQNKDGVLESDPNATITLTLSGCEEQCGNGFALFSWDDNYDKLSTWLIPVLLFLANMNWTPIGPIYTVCSILHVLGDPIDAIWSLLTKREVARRALQFGLMAYPNGNGVFETLERQQSIDIATIITVLDEVADKNSPNYETNLIQQAHELRRIPANRMKRLAHELCDVRVFGLFLAIIAILVFWANLGLAFVMAVEATNPPGNRVGLAMIFSWLMPLVLLSAETGAYVSRRVCSRILRRYSFVAKYLRQAEDGPEGPEAAYHVQPWLGVIYTYRPRKWQIFPFPHRDRSPFRLAVIACGFVFLACAAGFAISYDSPTVGLSCRPLSILIFFIFWLFSVGVSSLMSRRGLLRPEVLFRWMMIKDGIIAILVVVPVILFYMGLDNSCWCWSAVFSQGRARAYVQLTVDAQRALNNRYVYPPVVYGTIIIQLCIYIWVRWNHGDSQQIFQRQDSELDAFEFNNEMEMYEMIQPENNVMNEEGSGSPLVSNAQEDHGLRLRRSGTI